MAYQLLKLLLLLAAAIHRETRAQICPTPPDDGGGDFTLLCNPYEFDERYYPHHAQEWALDLTIFGGADVNRLSMCLKSPFGVDAAAGTQLWLVHYTSCEIGTVDDCEACLEDTRRIIRQQCPNRAGAQAASVRCCARYEVYRFCNVVNE
ncbi:unnamed protein product [Linum trigynum]|uniref:Gnk2-homologous domain-containing protein n=1 Tax=Linum trigynum TaxID=586398 RepID=A0AAV2C8W1_9ROSI